MTTTATTIAIAPVESAIATGGITTRKARSNREVTRGKALVTRAGRQGPQVADGNENDKRLFRGTQADLPGFSKTYTFCGRLSGEQKRIVRFVADYR